MRPVVCIIDDDDVYRANIELMLRSEGFETVATGDPRKAIDLISGSEPSAIVVDLIMPEKDGIELIGEIRSRWPAMRIIAISGGGRVGPDLLLRTAEQLGARACLKKPFTAQEIASAVTGR